MLYYLEGLVGLSSPRKQTAQMQRRNFYVMASRYDMLVS